jgi:hypothetical protein
VPQIHAVFAIENILDNELIINQRNIVKLPRQKLTGILLLCTVLFIMEQNMNTKLVLENSQREQNELTVFADSSDIDLVGFTVKYKGEDITMCDEPVDGNAQEYFHLDKFQVRCLIDYLKRIYQVME